MRLSQSRYICISAWLIVKASCRQNLKAELCQLCFEDCIITKVHCSLQFPQSTKYTCIKCSKYTSKYCSIFCPNTLTQNPVSVVWSQLYHSASTDALTTLLQNGPQHLRVGWGVREVVTVITWNKSPKGTRLYLTEQSIWCSPVPEAPALCPTPRFLPGWIFIHPLPKVPSFSYLNFPSSAEIQQDAVAQAMARQRCVFMARALWLPLEQLRACRSRGWEFCTLPSLLSEALQCYGRHFLLAMY